MGEERPWEKCHPPDVHWHAPIEMAPLPVQYDAFTEARPGITSVLAACPRHHPRVGREPRNSTHLISQVSWMLASTGMTPARGLRRETLR